MKICFPICNNQGLNSQVNNHFGSTKEFLIFNTRDSTFEIHSNNDSDHQHGICQPLRALDSVKVNAVIVGGVGAGALSKLNAMGIEVYRANPGTVEENLVLHKKGLLVKIDINDACSGHEGCSHD